VPQPTSHSAAPQAVGYLYQCEYALLALVEQARQDPTRAVGLEVLDDVHFESSGTPTELLQTKHHVGRAADLSDRSPDLWRTLAAWLDALELVDGALPALTLVTTQVASTGAVSILRQGPGRDADAARVLLEQIAAEDPGNQSTAAARRSFLALAPSRRAEVVNAITVRDATVNAAALDAELVRTLFPAPPPGREAVFLGLLKGHWHGVALKLLMGNLDRFSGEDLQVLIDDLLGQLRDDNLPIDPGIALLPFVAADAAAFAGRPFVVQLQLIALQDEVLWRHIRDYHRAYTQRSQWLRHHLIGLPELERYERRLTEEWELAFHTMCADLQADTSEPDRQRGGRELLAAMATRALVRLRERFDEPFVTRGTLHELADRRVVGWHPDFVARLEELLAPTVADEAGA
jgi:hypothetical protein